jgi:hypothetical protein
MTVNRQGTPVAATDNTGATVPVAAVDSRTGEPRQLAPVEDAVARTPEQIAGQTTPPGPVAPPAQVDLNNMTQEQLNQTLSENNPYLESTPIQTVAVAPTETQTDTTPVADLGVVEIVDQRPEPVAPVYIPPPLSPPVQVAIPPSEPIPEVQVPEQPAPQPEPPAPEPPAPPVAPPTYPPIYVPPVETPPATRPGYGPITPLDWGQGVPLDMSGLNPGYITNVPRQYEPSGVRSQYYYGPKPYQTGGPTGQVFDPALYRSAPGAPVAPYGLQQMYNPQTQTIENLLRGVGLAAGQAPYNRPGAPKI